MYLVTGSSGYIGHHLCQWLHDLGIAYKGVDIAPGMNTHILCDLSKEKEALHDLGPVLYNTGIKKLIHLAGLVSVPACEENQPQAYRSNIDTTFTLARLSDMYGIPLVYASTVAAIEPANVYGRTKYLAEQVTLMLSRRGAVVRFPNIIGGHHTSTTHLLPTLFNAIIHQKTYHIYGPLSVRSYASIYDAFDAVLNADQHTLTELAGYKRTTEEMVDTVFDVVGKHTKVRYEAPRPGDQRCTVNSLRLHDTLYHEARRSLEETILEAWELHNRMGGF